MEDRNTSFIDSAETVFIEIFKLFVSCKYTEALEQCENVPEPDKSSFLIKSIKANILTRLGGYENNFLDFYNEFKTKSSDVVEQCKISLCYAKLLKKLKRFSEALKECEFIIEQSNQDIKLAEIDLFSYRAHQLKAELMFEMLCFQTSYKHLQEAEKILLEIDTEDPESKRKIYNEKVKNSDKGEELIDDKNNDSVKEETKEEYNQNIESVVQIDDGDAASIKSPYKVEYQSEFIKYVDSLKVKRNIHYRLGNIMSMIMYMYAAKRDFPKAIRFQEEAEKYLMKSVEDNKNHLIIANFYQNTGDMYLRFEGKNYKDIAYEWYDKANKILEIIVGNKSIDYIYSMVDIGDVYLEKKLYTEAEAFYLFVKSNIEEFYGSDSIFKHRINSALVEVYSGLGDKEKGYDCSMENIDLGMKLYGDGSIFCLGFYMSGMSANIQKGTHIIAENILTKMLRVLENANEVKFGNQYFFLASILLGIVCYSAGKFDQAHMFFTGTLKKQLIYVDNEQNHPFLEQTYLHMAILYKSINNINSSLVMWEKVLKVHQRIYGDNSFFLSADYKNIGVCLLGVGKVQESITALQTSEQYSKIAIKELKEPEDVLEEK